VSVRALIVDDEPLARKSLVRHLRPHSSIKVIGECGDGQSAVAAILAGRPDLVFLDVQMPEIDGFEVIERVTPDRMPAVIFVTAYDHYAVRAFDANAVDYLLKPFRKERFERALARAKERIAKTPDPDAAARLVAALEAIAARGAYLERIPVSENGRIVFVTVEDIEWIESAGNYARLHFGKHSHDIRETLASLEHKLDPKRFARVHRSTIVNLYRIKEIQRWFHGHHVLLLESGQKVRMSRYQYDVAERLGCSAVKGSKIGNAPP
jgi:two-component system, LytTR family, response regulator